MVIIERLLRRVMVNTFAGCSSNFLLILLRSQQLISVSTSSEIVTQPLELIWDTVFFW